MTYNEIQHLLATTISQIHDLAHRLRWSRWRRRHQAHARHYRQQAATEQATVTWDPKDPADTVTTGYREGGCSGPSTSGGPCFVRVSQAPLTGNSFTFHHAATGTNYFIVCAENSAFQHTCSAILTITN